MNLHAEDIYSIGVAHGPAGPAVANHFLSSNDSTKVTRCLDNAVKFKRLLS